MVVGLGVGVEVVGTVEGGSVIRVVFFVGGGLLTSIVVVGNSVEFEVEDVSVVTSVGEFGCCAYDNASKNPAINTILQFG